MSGRIMQIIDKDTGGVEISREFDASMELAKEAE